MNDDEKAKLYRQIIVQTNEHVLLERMRLHGFWPAGQGLPQDPPDEAAERKEIEAAIASLRAQHATLTNPDKALAEERKRRWEESKQKRAKRKAEKEVAARERRIAHDAYRQTTIVHAGEGVSSDLQDVASDAVKLTALGLPVLHRSEELATAIGAPIAALRWLTFHRRGATVVHYHRYEIPKKSGGMRAISAPKAGLARCQRWLLENILERIPPTGEAHGFVVGRSIVSNATPHAGRGVVINLDLKDFFPSLTFRRVKGLFRQLGYSGHLTTTLALLCTEPPRVAAQHHGKLYHVALGERMLPQGACTSPAITNLICRKLDRRLHGLAQRHGFAFTRYADDLTFSGDESRAIGKILKSVRAIVADEGFTIHPTKTRVMRKSNRQEVTGVTVNERPTLNRQSLRELRAMLHNAVRHGLASQNRENRPNFFAYLQGRVALANMIDPERGAKLKAMLQQVRDVS